MKGLKLILQYIPYYLKGQNRHDLHSPFLYNLNEHVFRFDKHLSEYVPIEDLRRKLLNDRQPIKIRDFGAGFGGKVYQERTIGFITKRSGKQAKYARLLSRLVSYFKPEFMLEVGTSVGISALYQLAGNPEGKMITLEGCENTATLAEKSFKQFPGYSIQLLQGEFNDTLPKAIQQLPKLDYVFLDGNHKMEPTLKYFNWCLEKINAHSVIVIDDINWSDEMREAWRQIKSHPKVTVSIDVFMMGIVFFDPALSRESFMIRY